MLATALLHSGRARSSTTEPRPSAFRHGPITAERDIALVEPEPSLAELSLHNVLVNRVP